MSSLIVTLDIDWACEPAIEETLAFLEDKKIFPTVFTTHHSPIIEAALPKIEVGLHPYFGVDSSQGSTILEVVQYVMDLPHNMAAFRCHRFGTCNKIKQAMVEAGMVCASNVCTDLEIIPPFRDRFGLIEFPIFWEDGGYLWRNHPMSFHKQLQNLILRQEIKVILIHPMHFVLNTPNVAYMDAIKQSVDRKRWNHMTPSTLHKLKWRGYGIRNLISEVLQMVSTTTSLRQCMATR